jgi:hypothetical protein
LTDGSQRTVRFIRAQIDSVAGDRSRAVVEIAFARRGNFTGTAEGGLSAAESLRTVARATAEAVAEATRDRGMTVRIRGVQQIDVLGQAVLVVSLVATREGKAQTLLGICDEGADQPRAVAFAVLHAINRFLGVG